jgi:hypothetical protein
MRYIFLLIFFSTACWKIRAGGIFNPEQMSGILVSQHSACLAAHPAGWYAKFIMFFISSGKISYTIYILATALELFFFIGFFTKRFDRLLICLFLLFILFDCFFMKINYVSWASFLGCLWFSGYAEPYSSHPKFMIAKG